MRYSTPLILLPLVALYAEAAKVIQMDISKRSDMSYTKLRRRADFSESIINNSTEGSYQISTAVGTPGQNITLVLDTGSSDVFVLASTADQCTNARLQREYGPCVGGTFNSADSSTYKLVNTDFDIEYESETGSTGDYFTDVFALSGGHSVTGQQMGLALKTTVGTGIMGIGYDTNEAATTEYPSVIDNMMSQGLISTRAYSLWLNDLDASTGSILFGGIDTSKYHGSLIALPIQKDSTTGGITSFTVALSGITVSVGSTSNSSTLTDSSFVAPVVLDSGTTLTYLPDDTVNQIYSAFNVYDDTEETGYAFIDCKYLSSSSSINYTFGGTSGPTIQVPLTELVTNPGLISTPYFPLPFESTCIFGLQSSGTSDVNILGDTFLRSAYVVYDLSANQVALANTNYNATGTSNIVEITTSGIPNVSGTASAVTVSATATYKPGVGNHRTTVTTVLTNSAGSATATETIVATAVATSVATSVTTTAASTSKSAAFRTVPPLDFRGLGTMVWAAVAVVAGAGMLLL